MAQVTQGCDCLLVGRWLLRLRAAWPSPTPSSPVPILFLISHLTLTSESFHTLSGWSRGHMHMPRPTGTYMGVTHMDKTRGCLLPV